MERGNGLQFLILAAALSREEEKSPREQEVASTLAGIGGVSSLNCNKTNKKRKHESKAKAKDKIVIDLISDPELESGSVFDIYKNQFEELQTQFKDLQTKNAALQTKNAALQTKNAEQDANITRFKTALDAANRNIEGVIDSNKAILADAKKVHAAAMIEIREEHRNAQKAMHKVHTESLLTNDVYIEALREQIDELTKDLAYSNDNAEKCSSEVFISMQKNTKLHRTIECLRKQLENNLESASKKAKTI
jgi:hypothetical protein